ncbi:MAG: hypothetical protein IPL46_00245 [Saprospiraceae bacterium]|nr:hypothetical protein [Saprospiraceae bacterium]
MEKGIEQLEIWLFDLIKVGLLQYDFSEDSIFEISSRMVDAKMGGVARRLRRLTSFNRSDPTWFHSVLQILGDLYLLVSVFKNKQNLSENILISAYTMAGFNLQKNDLSHLPTIDDHWLICGQEFQEEENLRSRYTWIMGAQSKRSALLLDFAFGRTDFEASYSFNRSYQAKLIYYPGSFSLRAQLLQPSPVVRINYYPAAFDQIDKFLDVFASAVSKNLWISEFPACLKLVSILKSGSKFLIQDQNNQQLQLGNNPEKIWPFFATFAMQPCNIFGVWNGHNLRLLSIQKGLEFIQITS